MRNNFKKITVPLVLLLCLLLSLFGVKSPYASAEVGEGASGRSSYEVREELTIEEAEEISKAKTAYSVFWVDVLVFLLIIVLIVVTVVRKNRTKKSQNAPDPETPLNSDGYNEDNNTPSIQS